MNEQNYINWPTILIRIIIIFTITLLTINIWSSFSAHKYGLTPPEMMKELWLIFFFISICIGIINLINFYTKTRMKKTFMIILVFIIIVSITNNQMAISLALADTKNEYAKAVGSCSLEFHYHSKHSDILCQQKLSEVEKIKNEKLRELKAIQIIDWEMSPGRPIQQVIRNSVYLFIPPPLYQLFSD